MILRSNGPRFTRLVISAYRDHQITASDVTEYLGAKIDHLPKVEREVFTRSSN